MKIDFSRLQIHFATHEDKSVTVEIWYRGKREKEIPIDPTFHPAIVGEEITRAIVDLDGLQPEV